MLNYHGRRFRPAETEAADRVAVYSQDGSLLWGEFTGGGVRRGALAGTCAPDGVLDFAYCMVLDGDQVISGRCHSTPSLRADGGIDLREQWQRYGPDGSTGISHLTEIVAPEATLRQEEA